MRKAEVQVTLKKGADEGVRRAAPPSPIIPPKRSKANPDQAIPEPGGLGYPMPSPPVFVRKMRNAAVGTGCDIRLKVTVAGDPQPSLYWYHNDDILNMDNQEYGGLWIRDCKPSDAGLYTCIANNHLGEVRSSAVLAVLDLGEDSETTEDEGGDFETKEDQAEQAGDQVMESWPDNENIAPALQDLSKTTRGQSEDFTREPHVPSPSSPRIIKRPSTSPMSGHSGSAPTASLTPRKKLAVPTDYQDTVPGEFEEKVKQPKSAMSQSSTQDSRPQTPLSEYSRKEFTPRPSPKLTRASSKVFEKVRGLEERRRSLDQAEGSISGRSWAGFNRAASVDSDDGGSRLGISRESSKEDLREALKEDADQRRSKFKQRAASLEDRPRYSQKVQDIENKFTEELQRIKKLVGKPHLKKSFSTEQLTLRGRQRQALRKIEPIPLHVVQKLQERERAQSEKEEREKAKECSLLKSQQPQQKEQLSQEPLQLQPRQMVGTSVTPESMQLADLPGQREMRRVSPIREVSRRSPSPATTRQQRAESPSRNAAEITLRKVERRPASPLVQRVSRFEESTSLQKEASGRNPRIEVTQKVENKPESPLAQRKSTAVQERSPQAPPKPPRLDPNTPLEEKNELFKPRSMIVIPTIVVEDEPMEEEVPAKTDPLTVATCAKEEQTQKTKAKGRRTRPMSPELDSSDDSYVSAGEDISEAPVFEFPLQDMVAFAGTDVLLKCIIAGTPFPEVTWRKDNAGITSSANYVVKTEGERHTLLIKFSKLSDSGTYHVIATNEVGKVSSSATLSIKTEPVREQKGNLGISRDISSPITSDEEYMSPLEDYGGPEPRKLSDTPFREPPTFLGTMNDQAVNEGQEVTISVRISGQPKPMLYWLRDRVTIKTGPRHIVRETEDCTFEMIIKSVVKADAGVYTCKIINEYGTKQCETTLQVREVPVEPGLAIIRPVKDITAKAGETVLFECHVTGPQDTDVDWLADGKLIQPALLNCKMHFDGRRCRLLLNSVHEDDSGSYTCKLSTAKEELTSCGKLKVIPSIEPLFTRKLDVLEVIEGRNARFDCKVSGTPPPRVTWSHFDHPLVESDDVRVLQEGGRHSLIISHVTNEDEGFYTVIARNAHGEGESSAELYVQEPRPAISMQMAKLEKMPSIPEEPEVPENEVERFTMPDFVKPLYDLDVIEGKEAVLKCKVAGLPYPTIVWFHNGKKIDSTEDRKMMQFRDVHSLVIRSVCHAHGGVYKSVISNKVGKATCYAHLYVTDVLPDPPDGAPVVEAVTGKTITLSWRKPRRLDPSIDSSSLMYAIQQQALGSIQWTIIASSLRETSYTVSTLSKGVRYAFRVMSLTAKAFSKPSLATDPVLLLDRGPYLQEAPVIIDKPDTVYVMENQSICISVTLNHVNATVIWKRGGVVIANRPGLYETAMPDDDQHTLRILKVRSADIGQLVCVASNKWGSDTCTLNVEMAAPPTFETIMEDMDVSVSETLRFAVVVEGKPVPDILWFKEDTLLAESSHYTFVYDDNECSLVVLNTRPEDSGVYTCTAKNLAGSVSCKAELTVHAVKQKEDPVEDEESMLRKMRRLTDYYDIHNEIKRGAFSYVKRVTQKVGKMEYAAKFISARAKRKASALREMNLMSRLDHERILYFRDAFEKKNAVVIITELCNEELLERLTKKSTLTESDVRSCMRQLLEGLDYLHHQNIIHLDLKPDNILMADPHGDHIRICDFGNALEITPDEAQYCKYGTPEFVAPEIVNQTPVSKATDIWSVGVIAYLCLTGVSPFAGENDRSSVLNIRNYNVAFDESMFANLSREAKGFIIKLLVADRLRPDTQDCLRHPWFKTLTKGKAISTEALKKFVLRRKWQRSLISYKSKMVMRSIPELLNDSSNHISIAVPRHLKEGSPPPSSSSDSDEDIDELPFIPMPLAMEFSGSRMSLNEIQGDEEGAANQSGTAEKTTGPIEEEMECETSIMNKEGGELDGQSVHRKRSTKENDKGLADEDRPTELQKQQSRRPLLRGSSMDSDKPEDKPKRGQLRRGGSADSALLLRIPTEQGAGQEKPEDSRRVLKKALSMELPRRSTSPGAAKMSQEDYAMKLELMRQRLLRGGSADSKFGGLRGPLLETLGVGDEKRATSLERYSRGPRLGPPPLTRAASSDSPRDDVPKPKVFRKSASFSQGDTEPIPLHRRSGAPLEIPLAQIEERRLKEAISMSALTDPIKMDSRSISSREPSPRPPTPESVEQEPPTKMEYEESSTDKDIKSDETMSEKTDGVATDSNFDERSSTSGFSEKDMSMSEEPMMESDPVTPREPSPAPVAQRFFLEEKIKEQKQEMIEEVEKESDSNVEAKAREVIEVKEKVIEEMSKPVKLPEIVIATSSIMVAPTQQYASTTANIVSTYVTPSVPTRVVLPDGTSSAYASIMQTIMVPALQPLTSVPLGPSTPIEVTAPEPGPVSTIAPAGVYADISGQYPLRATLSTTEHPAVYSRVASPELVKEPSPTKTLPQPYHQQEHAPEGNVQDIASEEVFEARFKKRESSLSRGLKLLSWSKPEDKQATISESSELSEEMYRPRPMGAPLEFAPRRLEEKSKSVQDLREAQKDQSFMKRLSMRLKRTPSAERKEEKVAEEEPGTPRRRLSWALGRRGSQERKEVEMVRMDGVTEPQSEQEAKDINKPNESPVLAMRRKIESTVAGISMRIRSHSEERRAEQKETKSETKKTPILSMLRRSASEGRGMRSMAVPQNQLATQSGTGASSESLESMSSMKSETSTKGAESERRSRWDRWGLTRGKKDKTVSQPDIPTAIARENGSLRPRQYTRLASDFPPVFHIKLRDHVLLEGDPVTLSCLPAGSPHPQINWMKDKKPLEIDPRMNMITCPDGRQLLMIMKTTKKDAGLYECVATNPLAVVSSSCTLSLARLPSRPGTPEVPQRYKNTALVVWRPSDTMAPCTYSLERKAEGENNWLIVATGVADCYYNVVDLPPGVAFRFRVASVNKAGQGPYSNLSDTVCLDASEPQKSSATVVVKTVPAAPVVMMSSMTLPPIKSSPSKGASSVQHPAPTATAPPSVSASKPVVSVSASASQRPVSPVQAPSPGQAAPVKAKSTLNINMGKPQAKLPPPPVVLPKPQSPINIAATRTSPIVMPTPPPIGKPISSVPMYTPTTTASNSQAFPLASSSASTSVTTTPALVPARAKPVVLVSSLTPVVEGGSTSGRMTPSGRSTPSGRATPTGRRTPLGKPGEGPLRQGVPQKPYTFMDEKARGRFGVIRECRENATGNLFMAKIVPYEAENKQAVLQEYDILKSLHHEKIMALHEAYVTPRYLVLISECCSGKELLYSLIDRFRYSEDDVVAYIVQLLQGLDYLHSRRILHLDIKPANIMVTYMNVVKIIDFGTAQNFNPLFLKQFDPPVGTLEYMSPEMLKGDVVGPPADIWSVGVLTFIMLSGRSPFLENDPQETEAKIQAAKFDHTKLYENVSQSASLFLKKILCSYPWARPSIKDCFNNSWLQDAYLMRLRRQTLTFTTTRLKDFLAEQQSRRTGVATTHKVLLRSYQSSPQSSTSPTTPTTPTSAFPPGSQ